MLISLYNGVAVCMLHNFMMSMNEVYDVEWEQGVQLRPSQQILRQHGQAQDGADVRDLLRQESDQFGISAHVCLEQLWKPHHE